MLTLLKEYVGFKNVTGTMVFSFLLKTIKRGPIKSIKFCWRRAGSMTTDLKVRGKLWFAYN